MEIQKTKGKKTKRGKKVPKSKRRKDGEKKEEAASKAIEKINDSKADEEDVAQGEEVVREEVTT